MVVNQEAVMLFGFSREELIGEKIEMLIPERFRDIHVQHRERYMSDSAVRIMGTGQKQLGLTRGGREFDTDVSLSPIETGQEILIYSAIRDISDRKQAEDALRESEERFRGIFDQTDQLMGVLDINGTILDVNTAALQFAGVERSALLGKRFDDTPWWAHSEELQQRLRDALEKGRKGEGTHFEATHLLQDGEERFIDFTLTPIRDEKGEVVLLIPMGYDITERKQTPEGLARKRGAGKCHS